VPAVETYGIEPIPTELRTVRWRDLFAINFTFFLNPVMYVLGALAVVDGGLPLWWAVAAMVLGQAIAYALLVIVAQPGVDDGLPGQVAMRATLGYWGARVLSSTYRVIVSTYWFAAQALTAAFAIQAIAAALELGKPPLIPVALAVAAFHATLAVLGFDVMRWLLRVVLPISIVLTGVLVALFVTSDDPQFAIGRVFDSPSQQLTWVGFATYVTVMCGASLTLVTNIADFCRYTPTRRDMRLGFTASALVAAAITTFVGGYAAAATGETNPFVAAADLTSSAPVLVVLVIAILVQGIAANVVNTYTAGMSVVNAVPRLGRLVATALAAVLAVALSSFPDFIESAQDWITHLGNVAAPLTGVIVADYLVVQRSRIDVDALFDEHGRYRFVRGVNVVAVTAVAIGVAVYYAVPDSWVKVLFGVAVGAGAYLVLAAALRTTAAAPRPAGPVGSGANRH
jgi:NCS1 family nucleobase:cation symporter-1